MKKKELCQMCCDYSANEKCDHEHDCKLLGILKENESLKKENKMLKKDISNLEHKMSYMINPTAIGNGIHEMGN